MRAATSRGVRSEQRLPKLDAGCILNRKANRNSTIDLASYRKSQERQEQRASANGDDVVRHVVSLLDNTTVLDHTIRLLFLKMDGDHDGKLSFDDVRRAIKSLHETIHLRFEESENKTKNRMLSYDLNGDGMLDSQEFSELCRGFFWSKYEEFSNTNLRRSAFIGEVQGGVPSQFYHIGKKVGEGSFGTVHEAEHCITGYKRVMKSINKKRCERNGMPLEKIKDEINVLVRLDHPHVLRLFEHYVDASNFYMILDVCNGGELTDVFNQQSRAEVVVPELWIARVFRHVLEGIAYIHNKGVMHKDLKFPNVMLRDRSADCFDVDRVHAVIIDVGLAELFGNQHGKNERSNQLAGTLETMAPEVLSENFSHKCDVWSIGCMLFAMFNPKIAWCGNTPNAYPFIIRRTEDDRRGCKALQAAQLEGPPMHFLSGARQSLQYAVGRMLTYNEKHRPSAVQCLRFPWFTSCLHDNQVTLSADEAITLVSMGQLSLWSRRVMMRAAVELPASGLQMLSKLFENVDTDHDGVVSRQDVCKVMLMINFIIKFHTVNLLMVVVMMMMTIMIITIGFVSFVKQRERSQIESGERVRCATLPAMELALLCHQRPLGAKP
eukprot:TRINITY_DN23409_c0_g1_i2.p1 TRINITY_DN23409_c0_g1~~TRINITY_DN23409_c0_g1_i2.p1  ORF type:complete len:607 (-),score=90.38 TRINITY_DN23409_c0_g1_i2:412-2232(-)